MAVKGHPKQSRINSIKFNMTWTDNKFQPSKLNNQSRLMAMSRVTK